MKRVEDSFIIHRARSAILSRYSPGPIPYLANGLGDNAVAAYVTPLSGDRVFDFRAIVVSAFGETTLQMPPFIAYGAAGTSLTILEPRMPMNSGDLAYIAAWLGKMMDGRFTWYYRSIAERIKRMPLPDTIPSTLNFDVKPLLPQKGQLAPLPSNIELRPFVIEDLFYLRRAKSSGFDKHERGNVAFVSNGIGTGIVGYVEPLPGEKVFGCCAVVISALSGATVQTPPFIARGSAGSGLAVLKPKQPMSPEMLLCAAAYFNRTIRWRFSWSRQITTGRLRRLNIFLPTSDGIPDNAAAKSFVSSVPYWGFLKQRLNYPTFEATA